MNSIGSPIASNLYDSLMCKDIDASRILMREGAFDL
jgi:hypothetical protein